MPKGLVNESSLNSIGTAINVLNGTEGTYLPSEMGEAIIDAIPTETASGNPINITDAAAYPAVSVVTTLEPIQAGSGDPSPENVRPITGHTGVELTRTGKNLLDFSAFYSTSRKTRASAQILDSGQISFTNTQTESTGWIGCETSSLNLSVSPINIYRVPTQKGDTFVAQFTCIYYEIDSNNNVVARSSIKSANEPYTIQRDDCIAVTFRITPTAQEIPAGQTGIAGIAQIELNSTATTYEPYTLETHSITFPQAQSPVYGCEVDWTNGVLRVTEVAFKVTDFSSWIYQSYANFKALYISLLNLGLPECDANKKNDTLFDKFKTVPNGGTQPFGTASMYVTDKSIVYLWNNDDFYADEASMKQSMTAIGGVQFCYFLATPIEIPLTPEVITLLKGDNNIWTDSGTSAIEYKVDLQSYIQKLIDEASAQASASLSVSPLSLSKSSEEIKEADVKSADEVGEEAEKISVEDVKDVDVAEENT